jgi:hypothetical protein
MKATPPSIASNSNDVSTASVSEAGDVMMTSFSEAGDVMMTSSDQKGNLLKKMNFTLNKDPPEGKTTAIVAVMRNRPKHGHHHQHSNKHYKRKLVRVLLDSGSDGDLIFMLPSTKRLVPQSWNTSSGRFQTTRKAEIELNFFKYSDSKRYLVAPDIVEYSKIIGHSMTLF